MMKCRVLMHVIEQAGCCCHFGDLHDNIRDGVLCACHLLYTSKYKPGIIMITCPVDY